MAFKDLKKLFLISTVRQALLHHSMNDYNLRHGYSSRDSRDYR